MHKRSAMVAAGVKSNYRLQADGHAFATIRRGRGSTLG